MKRKDKKQPKKTKTEQDAISKLNKRIKEGEEKKIPKGYKATISNAGAVIMVSNTSDLAENGKNKKKAPKKAKSETPKVPKNTAPKPVGKGSERKPDEPKKPVKSPKKSGADPLKHSDKDEEMQDLKITPVIINLGGVKAKPAPKVLRRVAKTGGYTAWDDIKRNGKTFATEKEAKDYAADLLKKTGKIVLVSPTDRQVTHSFKPEEKINKK